MRVTRIILTKCNRQKDPKTTGDSGAGDFIAEFFKDYNEEDSFNCKAQRFGHMQCLHWVYAGDPNWGCDRIGKRSFNSLKSKGKQC